MAGKGCITDGRTACLPYHLDDLRTWLPGDERGWVQRSVSGIQQPNSELRADAEEMLSEPAIVLDQQQREVVAAAIVNACRIRGWTIHALNVRSNHVHLVVAAKEKPEDVMRVLKQWSSKALSDLEGLPIDKSAAKRRKKWWTVHGSTKWINHREYLQNAIRYVKEGQ